MQNPQFAVQEVYRVAAQGCRVALVRPTDAMGNYPLQPKYEPVWNALEETGMVYGMHPFPAGAGLKPPGYSEQYSGAELVRRTMSASGVPHSFLTNVQNFQSEAALWVTTALLTGLFDRHPRLTAAVFEASSTWLSFLLDECDKAYRLYRNERSLPPLQKLPSETFFERCMTGFEGDEAPPPRFPEFYGDILIWSSDVYHHDGDDAWRARRRCKSSICRSTGWRSSSVATPGGCIASIRQRRSSASGSPRSSGRTGGRRKKKSRRRSPPTRP